MTVQVCHTHWHVVCVQVKPGPHARYRWPALVDNPDKHDCKKLTVDEAHKVVTAINHEDGFRAWQKLHQRFEPGLASRQGIILAEEASEFWFMSRLRSPARGKL